MVLVVITAVAVVAPDPPAVPYVSTAPPPAMPLAIPPPSMPDAGDEAAAIVSFIFAMIALTLVCVSVAYVGVVRPHQRYAMKAPNKAYTPEQRCTRTEPTTPVNTEALTRAKQANEQQQQKLNGEQPQKTDGDSQKANGDQQQRANGAHQQRNEQARTVGHSVSFARKVKPAVSFARCGRVELSSSDRRRRMSGGGASPKEDGGTPKASGSDLSAVSTPDAAPPPLLEVDEDEGATPSTCVATPSSSERGVGPKLVV